MYLIFRCDCGRAMYSKEGVVHRKCVCGKNILVKSRRIIKRAEDFQSASEAVRSLQEEKYGVSCFIPANRI